MSGKNWFSWGRAAEPPAPSEVRAEPMPAVKHVVEKPTGDSAMTREQLTEKILDIKR